MSSNRTTMASRSARFVGDYNASLSRHSSDDRTAQISAFGGHAYGNGPLLQPLSDIWGNNHIRSGLPSKRDASRSRTNNDVFLDGSNLGPTGSGALADSSDPWTGRALSNGLWDQTITSPTLQSSHSGSTSPSHLRSSISGGPHQSLADIHNLHQPSRPAIGQPTSYRGSLPKTAPLDPSRPGFKYPQMAGFGGYEDKENSAHAAEILYETDLSRLRIDHVSSQNGHFGGVSNSASGDSSLPPSRHSEASINTGLQLNNRNTSFTSFAHHHNDSNHSQRPSISGASGSYSSQNTTNRYADTSDLDLGNKFQGLVFGEIEPNSMASVEQHASNPYSSSNQNSQSYQLNGSASTTWNDSKGMDGFDNFSSQPFAEQAYFNKGSQYEKGLMSPAGSNYHRRGLNSPKYFGENTPPLDVAHQSISRGTRPPQGPAVDLERSLAMQMVQHSLYSQYQTQYSSQSYDYPAPIYNRQANVTYGYLPVAYPPAQISTRPARDQDVGVGVRSMLLTEFRANQKTNKRYELKDIYLHVVEFSGDQHGSRFIQQKLETANSDEKEQLFREIQGNALQLMTDVFGNYVIQKLFEHGNQIQKRVLAEQMKNHVMELSVQMYGCRVVQKALEHVLADQQAELVAELKADILKCVKDQNGNHVVQKAVERVPTEHVQFIIDAFRGQVHNLATHPYGCRVIQRILEYCKPHDQAAILEELHICATMLITDQYGNYVTQHVIQHGDPVDKTKIINIVQAQLLTLSKHKFASNVVEKSIIYGTAQQRKEIVRQLTSTNDDGISALQLMMKDQFGNYVIQKLLAQLKGEERDAFIEDMKPQLIALKKYNFGKQIAAIERLVFTGPPAYTTPTLTRAPSSPSAPVDISSNAPTPLLTNGQNSPQSSSVPSTTEEPIDPPASGQKLGEVAEAPLPNVVIDTA
ncbi:armadillo-type protein [Calycina marina]|uniref:Pumilio homology domain family member 3 n=1 Tax=Calycina marina TaxID=1763456 RepID=A0A9P7Z740_9HELO|nr:armadillo-type protein [Calycina marina]